jgi:hypothetical protein
VLARTEAQIGVLGHAQQVFVERAEPSLAEHLGADEHAMELDLLARRPDEMLTNVAGSLAGVTMRFHESPAVGMLFDASVSPRHVDLLPLRLPDEIQRPDDPGAGLLGASNELVDATGPRNDVVVDEDDIARLDAAQADVPGLVGREIVLRANELEAAGTRFGGQIALDRRRRPTIHVDRRERPVRIGVDRLEGTARDAEALARHDDDGCQGLIHDNSSQQRDPFDVEPVRAQGHGPSASRALGRPHRKCLPLTGTRGSRNA